MQNTQFALRQSADFFRHFFAGVCLERQNKNDNQEKEEMRWVRTGVVRLGGGLFSAPHGDGARAVRNPT